MSGPTKGIICSNSASVPLKQEMGPYEFAASQAQPLNCKMANIKMSFLST